jgi:hypothetical protein
LLSANGLHATFEMNFKSQVVPSFHGTLVTDCTI